MNGAAALGWLAALLAFPHPPSPMVPGATLVAEKFSSPAAAVKAFIGEPPAWSPSASCTRR